MELIDLLRPWLLALVFSLPRLMVAFAIMPILVETVVPGMIRNGVLVGLALFVLPLTHAQVLHLEPDLITLAPILLKEGFIGLLLGVLFSIPFWAVRATGFLLDMQRGSMSALFFSPVSASLISPLGNLLSQMTLALLFLSGGFLLMLKGFYLSYQTWPIHQFFPQLNADVIAFYLKQIDLLLYTVLLLAGPFIGLMLVIDLGSGLIGRYLPQLNVFLIAMPIKSALVFFLLALYIIIIARYLQDNFSKFGAHVQILDGFLR